MGDQKRRTLYHRNQKGAAKLRLLQWLPHKDSNLDKQIQKGHEGVTDTRKCPFYKGLGSAFIREVPQGSAKMGDQWVTIKYRGFLGGDFAPAFARLAFRRSLYATDPAGGSTLGTATRAAIARRTLLPDFDAARSVALGTFDRLWWFGFRRILICTV